MPFNLLSLVVMSAVRFSASLYVSVFTFVLIFSAMYLLKFSVFPGFYVYMLIYMRIVPLFFFCMRPCLLKQEYAWWRCYMQPFRTITDL